MLLLPFIVLPRLQLLPPQMFVSIVGLMALPQGVDGMHELPQRGIVVHVILQHHVLPIATFEFEFQLILLLHAADFMPGRPQMMADAVGVFMTRGDLQDGDGGIESHAALRRLRRGSAADRLAVGVTAFVDRMRVIEASLQRVVRLGRLLCLFCLASIGRWRRDEETQSVEQSSACLDDGDRSAQQVTASLLLLLLLPLLRLMIALVMFGRLRPLTLPPIGGPIGSRSSHRHRHCRCHHLV
mmetsp:Transcript_23950/g.66953  ORF Transcript_23950/g.66953 Transcript_23950/m.66953 type:complete len:241 (-) Transcript_23950:27-749(-)